MVEAAQQPEEAFWRCFGRTGPSRGWLCINGTLEGSTNWYAGLAKEWSLTGDPQDEDRIALKLPSWSNLAKYPGGRSDPQILAFERTLPWYLFEERFAGNPVPPRGLVHTTFNHYLHVRPMQLGGRTDDPKTIVLPPDVPFRCWVDPGYNHAYAVIAAAIWNDRPYLYDEIHVKGKWHDEVIAMALQRPWWQNVTKVVMDVAGDQHHQNESGWDVWKRLTGFTPKGKRIQVQDGIARTDSFLKLDAETREPGMYVSTRCPRTIWEYTDGYRRKANKDGDFEGERPEPINDDAAKAIAYGLIDEFGYVKRKQLKQLERDVPPWERQEAAKREFASSGNWRH
jgi:hypothetical protein